MKKINFIVILVALAAVGLGLLLAGGKRQTEMASDTVFPDLQKQVGRVDRIRLDNADGVVLDALRVETGEGQNVWGAADKANYPLDQDKVIKLLNSLVQAKLDSAKTAKPENHARLGLQDLTAKDSQARQLLINAQEQSWQLLIGNGASSGKGVFVRQPGEDQTWLTKAQLDLPADGNSWLRSKILDLDADALVSVSRAGHWTAVLNQGETDANWSQENMPEGRELNYDSIVKNTVDDILALELEALLQLKPYDVGDAQLQTEISLHTAEKGTIEISLYQSGEDNLVMYKADNADAHWNKWVFKVSQFQAGRLTKDLESFLQALPEEEPAVSDDAANP